MNIGAVVLCGGKSSRMGRSKASLPLQGETFLAHTLSQLQSFDEILLSVNRAQHSKLSSPYPTIVDQYAECGPMGGLHAALQACRSEALFAVSCDLPYFSSELADFLCCEMTPALDGVIPISANGRLHPLCAIYRKEVSVIFEQCLQTEDYKLRNALQRMNIRYVSVPDTLEKCLTNVNTPEDYAQLFTVSEHE